MELWRQPDKTWQPFPVEYKHGKPKKDDSDLVQLCAQALCLEEMLGCTVPAGAFYYSVKKRRTEVAFDERLRRITEDAAARLHELLSGTTTPSPEYSKRCESCSLLDTCLPQTAGKKKSVANYLARMTAL